jgi:hypothetical protein
VRLDRVGPPAGVTRKGLLEAGRELERRLLVHGTEMHTDTGAQAKVLQAWSQWRQTRWPTGTPHASALARAELEDILKRLNESLGTAAVLPWPPRSLGETSARDG